MAKHRRLPSALCSTLNFLLSKAQGGGTDARASGDILRVSSVLPAIGRADRCTPLLVRRSCARPPHFVQVLMFSRRVHLP